MNSFSWFFLGYFVCIFSMVLLIVFRSKRAEKEYQKYLASICHSCGNPLDERGECSAACSEDTEIHADALRDLAKIEMKFDFEKAEDYLLRELKIRKELISDFREDIFCLQQGISRNQSAIAYASSLLAQVSFQLVCHETSTEAKQKPDMEGI